MTMEDLRGVGAPADIGSFVFPSSGIVYQYTFSGTTYFCAARQGNRGWISLSLGTVPETVINAAFVALGAGAKVSLMDASYATVATINVPAGCVLEGMGNGTIINFNAGGNAITITGDNAKVRDLKVVITAGAGAGGTRPNAVYAAARANLEINNLWLYGERVTGDDASDIRQTGIVLNTCTDSSVSVCHIENWKRQGIIAYAGSLRNLFYGNVIHNNDNDGIIVGGSGAACLYNLIMGNQVNTVAWRGIMVNNSAAYNTITGNTIHGCIMGLDSNSGINNTWIGNTTRYCTDGVYFDWNCADNVIDDNVVVGNTNGIRIDGAGGGNCLRNTVSGNNLRSNGHGIFIMDNTDDTLITNNLISGSTNEAIQVDTATCERTRIFYNLLIGNGSAITDSAPASTWIVGNSGYNPVGSIATPWPAAAGAVSDAAAAQNNPSNHVTYTITESPKLIILTNTGGISGLLIDGVAVAGITTHDPQIYKLFPGQTFHVDWATTTPNGQVFAE